MHERVARARGRAGAENHLIPRASQSRHMRVPMHEQRRWREQERGAVHEPLRFVRESDAHAVHGKRLHVAGQKLASEAIAGRVAVAEDCLDGGDACKRIEDRLLYMVVTADMMMTRENTVNSSGSR